MTAILRLPDRDGWIAKHTLRPQDVLAVYRDGDDTGRQIAEYYAQKRPGVSVRSVTMSWNGSDRVWTITYDDIKQLHDQIFDLEIGAIVWCGECPHLYKVTQPSGTTSPTYAFCDLIKAIKYHYELSKNNIVSDTLPAKVPYTFKYPDRRERYRQADYTYGLRYSTSNISRTPTGFHITFIGFTGRVSQLWPYWMIVPVNDVPYRIRDPYALTLPIESLHNMVFFQLWVGEVNTALDPNGDSLTQTKALIDRAIAAEQAYTDKPGEVIASGPSLVPYVGLHTYLTAESRGWQPYHNGISNYSSTFPDLAGLAPRYPTGSNTLVPEEGKTFVPINNVFLRVHGNSMYWGRTKFPETTSDYTYVNGAIGIFSQSPGMNPTFIDGMDPDYEVFSGVDTTAETPVTDATYPGHIRVSNERGISLPRIGLTYLGTASQATVEAIAPDRVILREDGNVVLDFTFSSMSTLRQAILDLKAVMPANWQVGFSGGNTASRTCINIRRGLTFAYGNAIEPYASYSVRDETLLPLLMSGACIGDWVRSCPPDGSGTHGRSGDWAVGDPLLRPFKVGA